MSLNRGTSSGTNNSNKTYKIGFQGALSGDNQQLGINEINSVNLAVDQANAKGDLGFKLEVLKSDDGGAADKAPAAAAALIQDPAVLGVVGPIFSGPTSATGKTYAAASMGLISPSATNATLTSLRLHHLPPDRPDRRRRGHAGRGLPGQEVQEGLRRR